MEKVKFDLHHPSGIVGIWFIGNAVSCYVAMMVFTIIGGIMANYIAALVFSIVGGINMLLGVICVVINSIRTKNGAGELENGTNVTILLIISSIIAMTVFILVSIFV